MNRTIHYGLIGVLFGCCLGIGQVAWTQSPTGVSADLMNLYRKTEAASTVSDFTQIVDFCRSVVEERSRQPADRDYAQQLLAWAANRRGELHSDQAGEMVEANEPAEAAKLDKLAVRDFQLAPQHDPKRWRARHNLAIALAMNKDLSGAIEQFTQVIDQNPKYSNAFYNRGELYFQTRRYEQAIVDYTDAIAIAPKDPLLFSSRGHARFLLEQFDSALADYALASELAPKSVELATDWADACQSLYRWKEAAEGYRRALKINANYPRALQNAAWMMATCPEEFYRDPATAVRAAELVAKNSPETYRLLDTMAVASAAYGDFAQARTSARRALELAPPSERPEIQRRADLFAKNRPYLQPASSLSEKSALAARPQPTAVGTGAIGPR